MQKSGHVGVLPRERLQFFMLQCISSKRLNPSHKLGAPIIQIIKSVAFYSLIVAIIFTYIYTLNFYAIPINSVFILSTIVYLLFFIFCSWKGVNSVVYEGIPFFIPSVINLGYCSISFLVQNSLDVTLINNTIFVFYCGLSIWFLMIFLRNYNINREKILFLIALTIFFQGIFITLNHSFPIFRWAIDSLLPIGGNFEHDPSALLLRSRGLSNSPGAHLSVVQAIGLLISCFFFSRANNFKRVAFWIFVISILVVSIFLSGRTGILVMPLCVVFLSLLNFSSFKRFISLLSKLSLLVFALVVIVAITIFAYLSFESFDTLSLTLDWIARPFISDSSLPDNANIWHILGRFVIFPVHESQFVWGNVDLYGSINKLTDLGYIRNLFGLGLVGASVFYLGYLFLFFALIYKSQHLDEKIFFIFLSFWIIIVEVKEPFLRGLGLNSIIFFLIFSRK